jgi:hypothetical protein
MPIQEKEGLRVFQCFGVDGQAFDSISLVTFSSRTPGRDVGGFAFWLYLLYYIYIHFMLDFIKRLVLFAIGFYIVIFLARNTLGGLSFSGVAKDITGALKEFQKIGSGANNTWSNGNGTGSSSLSRFTKTSKGAEKSVEFINLSRGEMVGEKTTIIGNINKAWLFENVGTARFLDEVGKVLGTAQIVADGIPTPDGKLPFSVLPQFSQGTAKTGYIVIEKVNNTGEGKNDAWFTLPITYPVSSTNNTSNGTSQSGSVTNTSETGLTTGTDWVSLYTQNRATSTQSSSSGVGTQPGVQRPFTAQ